MTAVNPWSARATKTPMPPWHPPAAHIKAPARRSQGRRFAQIRLIRAVITAYSSYRLDTRDLHCTVPILQYT